MVPRVGIDCAAPSPLLACTAYAERAMTQPLSRRSGRTAGRGFRTHSFVSRLLFESPTEDETFHPRSIAIEH
ncbi:hypothetical protein WK52_01575 [Burkholderia multivorans]|nr:hypothetical protein WK52_01575 [Burkholderia multivorans]